jgi:hypothetical protein
MHKNSIILRLAQLRLTVGYLGERAQFAWWPTAFYEPTSRPFLEPVFTKTSHLAQYHGVLEAARRLHDEHLNVGSYHLFRLPEEVEQDLHTLVQNGVGPEFSIQVPASKEDALVELRRLASEIPKDSIGPILIGNIIDLEMPEIANNIASAYLTAFSKNVKTYPYLGAAGG